MAKNISKISWPVKAWPRIIVAGRYYNTDKDFSRPYKIRYHAFHMYDYECEMKIDDAHEFSIRPGDITFTPANMTSLYSLPQPGHHLCVHFAVSKTSGTKVQLPLHFSLGQERGLVRERLLRIIHLHRQANESTDGLAAQEASAVFQEVMLFLGRLSQQSGHVRSSRAAVALENLVEIIAQRLAEPLTIVELADEVGMTQNHLAKLFKRQFGMTISAYVQKIRIEHAVELLMTTNLPVGLVGVRIGLSDPQYFNKLFRRYTGYSPTEYRNS